MNSTKRRGSLPSPTEIVLSLALGVIIGFGIGQFQKADYIDKDLAQLSTPPPSAASSIISSPGLMPTLMPSLDKRVNILLMGVDSNGRHTQRFVGTRSDTMMVVSLDPKTKKISVISIPRDSRVVISSPAHGGVLQADRTSVDKINAAHAYGGPDLAVATVSENFGVHIDRYLVVDIQGLKKLGEIVGPIDVVVEKKMSYVDHAAGLNIALEPGAQSLGPEELEQYVRFRHDARGDISRIERQQWLLRQLCKKLQDPQTLTKIPALYQCASDFVETNLSFDELLKIVAFAKDRKPSDIQSAMVPGQSTMINGGSYWLPDFRGATVVFNRLCGPNPISYRFGDNDASAVQAEELMPPYEVTAEKLSKNSHRNTYSGSFNDSSESDSHLLNPEIEKRVAVTVRYPRGSEAEASSLEISLSNLGYRVCPKIKADLADCQHEQIIQNSYLADASAVEKLKHQFPALSEFPSVLNPDSEASNDITIVISPSSHFEEPAIAKSTL